jgi:oligopeptide transport system substrate-binding protein
MGRRSATSVAARVVASCLLVASTACATGGRPKSERAADGEVRGGSFSLSISEPEHLLPATTSDLNGGQVLSALFTGLVEYDPVTVEPQPAMAESITSEDQRNWTIKIKPGWTFHNGEPVTAGSYVDAWNFAAYAPNAAGNASFFSKVEGYENLQGDPKATPPVPPKAREMTGLAVVDDTTFTVRLKEPFSQFPLTLGYHAFYPMPKTGLSDPKAFEQAPVGNGPYMMDGVWRHDEGIRVKRFAGYQGPTPSADTVEFRIYSTLETRLRDLQAGELDIATSILQEELPRVRAEFGDRFVERDSSAFDYLGFPMKDPAFGRKELRQALSMAIDRNAINQAIYNGSKQPAGSLVSPLVPGARKDACAACRFDPVKAKALLAQAGGWSGPLRLWFVGGRKNEEHMEAIANQLRQNLGITEVVFEAPEFAALLSAIKARKVTGPFRFNWLMDYPSPQSYLEPLYASTSSSNRTGYANPAVDQLIAEGNRAPSIEAAIKSYQEAEDIVLDDMPVIPLWFGKTDAAHSERVDQVVIDPFSRIRVQDVAVVG